MTIDEFKQQLLADENAISFNDVMNLIATNYDYTPTAFHNGLGNDSLLNEAGTNEGSCKLFSFALKQGFDKQQTLACFGDYYRQDVLRNPDGSDHQNIRNFIKYGWEGIRFEGDALRNL